MVFGTLSQAHLCCMACSPAALVLASASSHIFSPRWRCSAWGMATIDYFLFLVDFWKAANFINCFHIEASEHSSKFMQLVLLLHCSQSVIIFTRWSFWTSFRPRTSFESCFDIPSKFCSILSARTFLINNLIFSYCSEEPPVYSYWFPVLIDV